MWFVLLAGVWGVRSTSSPTSGVGQPPTPDVGDILDMVGVSQLILFLLLPWESLVVVFASISSSSQLWRTAYFIFLDLLDMLPGGYQDRQKSEWTKVQVIKVGRLSPQTFVL